MADNDPLDGVYIIPEHDPTWERMTNTPQMSAAMVSIAEGFFPAAQSMMPVDTGLSKAGLHVEPKVYEVNGLRRAGSTITFDRPAVRGGKPTNIAWAVEWGKGANKALWRMSRIMRKLR